jgi:hypothetical protein
MKRVRSVWRWLKQAHNELDYAQKRLLEIKTGQVLTRESRQRIEVERLNRLMAMDAYESPTVGDC